jgi:hypothetical protein
LRSNGFPFRSRLSPRQFLAADELTSDWPCSCHEEPEIPSPMPTRSVTTFQTLAVYDQLGFVYSQGTALAIRRQGPYYVKLYYLGHFFVEVHYNPHTPQRLWCVVFNKSAGLEPYLPLIHLPTWLR